MIRKDTIFLQVLILFIDDGIKIALLAIYLLFFDSLGPLGGFHSNSLGAHGLPGNFVDLAGGSGYLEFFEVCRFLDLLLIGGQFPETISPKGKAFQPVLLK